MARNPKLKWTRILLILGSPASILIVLLQILGIALWELFGELVFIDLLLSLDNLLVILLVLHRVVRREKLVLTVGLSLALVLRVTLTAASQELLHLSWLVLLGGLSLLGIANKLWPEDASEGGSRQQVKPLSPLVATLLVIVVDFLASFDNAMSNAGLARDDEGLGLLALAFSMLVLFTLLVVSTLLGKGSASVFERWLRRWRQERIRLMHKLLKLRKRPRLQYPRRRRAGDLVAATGHRRARTLPPRIRPIPRRLRRISPGPDLRVAGPTGRYQSSQVRNRRAAGTARRLRQLERQARILQGLLQVLRLGVYSLAVSLLAWTAGALIASAFSLPTGEQLLFRLALAFSTIGWHWLGPWLQNRVPWAWGPYRLCKWLLKGLLVWPLQWCLSRFLERWSWGRELLDELE